MKTVTLSIMNKDYRIECQDDEEEHLRKSAEYLNQKMQEVKDNLGNLGNERISVMAGLNISYEYLNSARKMEQEKSDIDSQMQLLLQKVNHSLA